MLATKSQSLLHVRACVCSSKPYIQVHLDLVAIIATYRKACTVVAAYNLSVQAKDYTIGMGKFLRGAISCLIVYSWTD